LLKNLEWKPEGNLGWKFNLPVLEGQMGRIGQSLAAEDRFIGSTLFVRGERSGYILDEDWSGIMDHFPLARLESVPGAGACGATAALSRRGIAVFVGGLKG
jgi:esterase